MITPGSTIGILGGGQLGRMLILAGRALGYRFHIFEPSGPCTAGMVADHEVNAPYSDEAALRAFAEGVDVITLEFENIPADTIARCSRHAPTYPAASVLAGSVALRITIKIMTSAKADVAPPRIPTISVRDPTIGFSALGRLTICDPTGEY